MIQFISKKLISVVFTLCALLCIVPFACAATTPQPAKIEIVLPTSTEDTHVKNTPQYSDTLKAEISPSGVTGGTYTWERFYNTKTNEYGVEIPAHYEKVGEGSTYNVVEADIDHVLKCTFTYGNITLSAETEPVTKQNLGKPKLTVKDNTYYGDTDGCISYLDQRMEYSHDGVTIFDVTDSGLVLLSGENEQLLDKNGYTWMVRFKETNLVMKGEWEVLTIKQGEKIDCSSITMAEELTLTPKNNTKQLIYETSPQHCYIATQWWSSSDPTVASVDQYGIVTAHANGQAIITCRLNEGDINGSNEQSASCTVTVQDFEKLQSVSINQDNISISITDTDLHRYLKHSKEPEDLKDYTETWTSSDESVATVANGLVTAIAPGETEITYQVEQNGIICKDSIKFSVAPAPSVDTVSSWSILSQKDLVVEFTSFPIDIDHLVVRIDLPNGNTETIPKKDCSVAGNTLTICHKYLEDLYNDYGAGKYTLHYIMPETKAETSSGSTDNSTDELISQSSYEGQGSLITLLQGSGRKASITSVSEEAEENTSLEDGKTELSSELMVTKDDSEELKEQSLSPAAPSVTVSIPNTGTITVDNKDTDKITVSDGTVEGNYTNYTITPVCKDNTVTNGSYSVTFTTSNRYSYIQPIVIKGFINTVAFEKDEVTLDYTCHHQLDLKSTDYLAMDAKYADLAADSSTTITWYLDNTRGKTEDEYCSIDAKTGVLKATKNTKDETVTVNLSITQSPSIYTKSKTFDVSISVKIDLYALISRDHEGQWEPLGRTGLGFVIGGVDEYYITNRGLHPKVTITDSANNNIPISYFASDTKYGYRVYYDLDNRIMVKLPYLFLRTCHVGTYHITFDFYSEDGTYIEGSVNSDFQVLPSGTPYTGDDFHALPYVSLLLLSSGAIGAIGVAASRKRKTSHR